MIVIFLLLFVGTHRISTENQITEFIDDRFLVNTVISQLFELFRSVVINGDCEKHIPVLDPYEFEYTTFSLTGDVMSASINFTNGVLYGLSSYELGPFNFNKSTLSIDLELTFPVLSFLSENYEFGWLLFGLLPILGDGNIQIEVHDVAISGKIYLKQSNDEISILISHLENVEFTIKSIKSQTQFDSNIDGIINAMISELLPGYLSRFSKAIAAKYADIVVEIINSILDKYESWKIIAVIL